MSRRTVRVRLAQLLLLGVWAWLLARPVYWWLGHFPTTPDAPIVMTAGRLPLFCARGDPLPWLTTRAEDAAERLSVERSGVIFWMDGSRLGRNDRWAVRDWFAPLPGLLLALAVPPLVADRLAGRWRWVLVGAAVGGLACGVGWMALTGWTNRGTVGTLVMWLREFESVRTAREWVRLRRIDGWDQLMPPATLFGLTVAGLAAAGALRPWRTAPPLQPHLPAEQPPPAGNTPL